MPDPSQFKTEIVSVRMSPDELRAMRKQELAERQNPSWSRHHGVDVPDRAQRRDFNALVESHLLSLWRDVKGGAEPRRRRPAFDAAAESYCPLCEGRFRADTGRCLACGVDTVAWA